MKSIKEALEQLSAIEETLEKLPDVVDDGIDIRQDKRIAVAHCQNFVAQIRKIIKVTS